MSVDTKIKTVNIGVGPAGQAGTSAGWVTKYEVDFTTQTPQSLATNGPHTIDGKTWNKVNSAVEGTPAALTSEGVVLIPSEGSDLDIGNLTAPGLEALVTAFDSDFEMGMGLRVWLYVTTDPNDSNTFDAIAVTEGLAVGGEGFIGYCAQRIAGSDTEKSKMGLKIYPAGGTFVSQEGAAGGYRVFMLELLSVGLGYVACRRGAFDAGFPTAKSLTPAGTRLVENFDGEPLTLEATKIFIGAARPTSSTSYTSKIARLKIQTRI